MLIGSMVGKPPSSNELFLINSFRHPKNIEDTGETFASDFPAMLELYVSSSHVVCLVYAVDDWVTFEHVATLRDYILRLRPDLPIGVVGNKIDLDRKKEDKLG